MDNWDKQSTASLVKTPVERRAFAVKNLIAREFSELILQYQQYTITEHMASIRRSKNHPASKEPYFWDDEELLKAIEKHRDELDTEAAQPKEPEQVWYNYPRIKVGTDFNRNK